MYIYNLIFILPWKKYIIKNKNLYLKEAKIGSNKYIIVSYRIKYKKEMKNKWNIFKSKTMNMYT